MAFIRKTRHSARADTPAVTDFAAVSLPDTFFKLLNTHTVMKRYDHPAGRNDGEKRCYPGCAAGAENGDVLSMVLFKNRLHFAAIAKQL